MKNKDITCQEFVSNIINKVGVLRTKQLVLALCKLFEITDEEALQILKMMQKNRRLLLSQDGWTFSVGAYTQFADDKFFDRTTTASTDYVISYDIENEIYFDKMLAYSLWYTIGKMPGVKDFILPCYPWNNCFICEDKDGYCLYQVIYVPKEQEDVISLLLRQLPPIESDGFRHITKRIAILEDGRHPFLIPHLGFREICAIDEREPSGYRVVETRSEEDAWSDYVK